MALQILADDEHYVVKVRMGEPYAEHEILDGLEAHTFTNVDSIPKTYVPHCYWDRHIDIFLTDAQTPNPHAYKLKQQRVFEWAKRNISAADYHAYGLHGHRERAKIFHAFVAMNVMAAMHRENIQGDHWYKVQNNLVGWKEFVEGIRPAEWTQTTPGGVSYQRLATAIGGFVTLTSGFAPIMDFNETQWAIFDRQYGGHDGLTHAGDFRRATYIWVIPPSVIPEWTHSVEETSEPLFEWDPANYRQYLQKVASIVPINIEE